METGKQEMQVKMRGVRECKGWTRWIDKQHFGRGEGWLNSCRKDHKGINLGFQRLECHMNTILVWR